jgi:hypothetical protein
MFLFAAFPHCSQQRLPEMANEKILSQSQCFAFALL